MNKIVALPITFILLIACTVALSPMVKASPKTIFVPDEFATIDDAIKNAASGDTVFVRKGTYEGPNNQSLLINKTINLIGENPLTTKINLHPPLIPMSIFTYNYMGYPDAMIITANYVKVSGFTINTPGGAISITGKAVQFENNKATSLSVNSTFARITNNNLDNGNGYTAVLYGSYHNVSNNVMKGIISRSTYTVISSNKIIGYQVEGLVLIEGSYNLIYNNNIAGEGWSGISVRLNVNGTFIAKNEISGCSGIHMEWASNSIVGANTIKDCSGITLFGGQNNILYANHLENNTIGLRLGYDQSDIARRSGPTTANNIAYNNNFINNKEQGLDFNWLGTNHWDNEAKGNYWTDYNGTDNNFDGIGDTPYLLNEAVSHYAQNNRGTDNYPLMTPFDISSINIQLPEWTNRLLNPPPPPSPTPPIEPTQTIENTQEQSHESAQPTSNTNQESKSVEEPLINNKLLSTSIIAIVSGIAIAIVALIYLKKKKSRGFPILE